MNVIRSGSLDQHFTYFVLNMSMSGLLYAATNLWVSVPCTLDMCPFISTDHLMVALATPNSLAHWVYLLSAMSFTIYRFCLFMSKSFSDRTTCIKALVIAPWALTSLLIFGTTGLGCYKRYNRLSLSYTYNCSNCNIFLGISFIDVNFYAGQAIPLAMITAYVIILASVYRSRRRNVGFHRRQSRVDTKLAFQFTVICFSQYLAALLFFVVPKFSGGGVIGVLLMNSIGTINVSVNPIVLLLFNHQIRSSVRMICDCSKAQSVVQDLTPTQWTTAPRQISWVSK
ncbi:unnamed protein product [Heligmosomoides polygyrus]|uniref:G_PROTEIN_RECEP_F1_2 domain-containing protein n=1 Tax=Heligmosomoides polygyrus TaxID=6339 RepID=A0A3P8AWF0_HELPZ|nr:unnamed protein product [Heligmosomoides polygyrus]